MACEWRLLWNNITHAKSTNTSGQFVSKTLFLPRGFKCVTSTWEIRKDLFTLNNEGTTLMVAITSKHLYMPWTRRLQAAIQEGGGVCGMIRTTNTPFHHVPHIATIPKVLLVMHIQWQLPSNHASSKDIAHIHINIFRVTAVQLKLRPNWYVCSLGIWTRKTRL